MYTYQPLSIKKFGSDDRGAVAITFGVMALALFFMAGIAVDYTRVMNVRGRLVEAADSAVLAAGKALLQGQSEGDIQQLALTYFNENIKSISNAAVIGAPTVSVNATTGAVNLDVKATVDMTLAGLGGFHTQDVDVVTEAVFSQKDIEVGMALDITGSMAWADSNGEAKIKGLKSAFEKFADRLIPDVPSENQRVRIGVAPYSASVNLGEYAAEVTDNKSTNGCVVERKSGLFSDSTDVFYALPKSAPKSSCPPNAVAPLSDDKEALISMVKSFNPTGATAGHLGAQWAWNVVSDQWGGTWNGDSTPDSYARVTEGKLLKAVVLMTDGEFNTKYYGAGSPQQAIALCNAMKAKGVVVFSVGFGLGGNSEALNTLQTCATPGDGYFADTSNASELEQAFEKFAGKLTELRLSK